MNPTPKPWSHLHPHGQSYLPLQDDRIFYADQPIALVVATTHDQAAYAGTLISVEYESQPPAVFDRQTAKDAVQPPQFLWPVASSVGNADKAISTSPVKLEQTYATADRHHNQMEPHATTAVWGTDGTLTLYETTQHIFGTRELVSMVLGVPQEKIYVICQFLGGGFGGKGYVWPHTLRSEERSRPTHPSTDVLHGRPPSGKHAGNQAWRRAKWQAERHPPRQRYTHINVRQLH
jgi:xanthine dehydrogenase YagR molybdenum-binding subunit